MSTSLLNVVFEMYQASVSTQPFGEEERVAPMNAWSCGSHLQVKSGQG